MTVQQAIDIRISRRKYIPAELPPDAVGVIQNMIGEYNKTDGVRMQLVLDKGEAFAGLRRSYGMFSGVQHYIGLIDRLSDSDDPSAYHASANTEKMGYFREKIVLQAVTLGLGTCWVGGTFDRKACPFILKDGEMVACTIVLGKTAEEQSLKEKLIRSVTHRKTKTAEELYQSSGPVPDWFMNGIRAVQKAPSAVNRQPVLFSYRDGTVTAAVQNPEDVGTALDLGIAKLHFEIGAGGGKWDFGNGAAFAKA